MIAVIVLCLVLAEVIYTVVHFQIYSVYKLVFDGLSVGISWLEVGSIFWITKRQEQAEDRIDVWPEIKTDTPYVPSKKLSEDKTPLLVKASSINDDLDR